MATTGPQRINPKTGRPFNYKDDPEFRKIRDRRNNARRVTINGKRVYLSKPVERRRADLKTYPTFDRGASRRRFERWLTEDSKAANTHGFIYIVWHPKQYEQEGVLKIGFASNLKSRLVAANTWSFSGSFEYLDYAPVLNMRAAEAMLHRMHGDVRLHGEWFRVREDQARAMLAMVASRFPLTEAQRALLSE